MTTRRGEEAGRVGFLFNFPGIAHCESSHPPNPLRSSSLLRAIFRAEEWTRTMESFEDLAWAEHLKWLHVGSLNIHSFPWPESKIVCAYTTERFAHPKDRPFAFTVVYQVFLSEGARRPTTFEGRVIIRQTCFHWDPRFCCAGADCNVFADDFRRFALFPHRTCSEIVFLYIGTCQRNRVRPEFPFS